MTNNIVKEEKTEKELREEQREIKRNEIKKEISKVIDKVKKELAKDRMKLAVPKGDLGFKEQFEVLAILQYLGYVVVEKENDYIIDLNRHAEQPLWLSDEDKDIANQFTNLRYVRRLSKQFVRDAINYRLVHIQTEIYHHILSGNDDKELVINKTLGFDELNDAIVEEIERLGYKVRTTSMDILITVEVEKRIVFRNKEDEIESYKNIQ